MKTLIVRLSVVGVLVLFTGSAFAGQSSKEMRDQIVAKTESIPGIGDYDLSVDARLGNVTLSGWVGSEQLSERVEQIARETAGVREVTNYLTVAPSAGARAQLRLGTITRTRPSDQEISERVRLALRKEAELDLRTIQLDTKDGVLRLSGDQRSFREIDRILSIALMVDGVRDIQNEITVQGRDYLAAAPH